MSSLVDLILGQQAILISLGVVGLVILLAVLIVVGVQMRKVAARVKAANALRAQKRQVEAELRKEEAARRAALVAAKNAARASKRTRTEEARDVAATLAVEVADATEDAAVALLADAEATEIASADGTVVADETTSQVATGEATDATTTTTEEASETPDAISALLSSVFVDEDAQERFDSLLRGFEPIEIKALEALTQHVAAQLKQALPATSGR